MSSNRAFTLIEILLVVIILGILAAIVVPRVSNAADTAKVSLLADDLRTVRMQIEVFTIQHDITPGYPDCMPGVPTSDDFVNQMVNASNYDGQCAPPGTPEYPFGPYFTEVPPNPINGKNTVQVIPDDGTMPASADDSHGWIYQPAKRIFKADCQGEDSSGVQFYDY